MENICIMEYFNYLFQEDFRIVACGGLGCFYHLHFGVLFIPSTCVNYGERLFNVCECCFFK